MPLEWIHWMLTSSTHTHRINTSSITGGTHRFRKKNVCFYHSNDTALQMKLNEELARGRFQATNSQVPELVSLAWTYVISQLIHSFRGQNYKSLLTCVHWWGARRVAGKKRKGSHHVSARARASCFLDKTSFNPHSNSIT